MSHTGDRLRDLARQLGTGSRDDVEDVWLDLWRSGKSKPLINRFPKATKAIITFARMKADGQLTGGDAGYWEMIEKVIAKEV